MPNPPSAVTAPTRIQVIGHGATAVAGNFSPGQAKLMAMRAAQVDAYRALAERVHGFQISGTTTVAAYLTQNEQARSYVDAFIRGARLASLAPVGDGNYEAVVELDLPVSLFDCFTKRQCAVGGPLCPGGLCDGGR